jgi:hypothetical protein
MNLKPTPAPTDAQIDKLLTGLAAELFADRRAAAADLEGFGSLAVPKIRDRLEKVTSAEVRERLAAFLKVHDRPGRISGCRLREMRAVELLEVMATRDARAALADLSTGDTPLSIRAAAAVRRLDPR